MIPISWIVFQKLLQDTLVNIRSKILGKIDLKNAITLCRLTSVFHTSYSSVYVSFSSDKVNSFINTSFSARWLFLYQKDSNVPQISTGFLCGYLAHRQYTAPPSPLPHGCILSPTWLYTTLRPKNKNKKQKKHGWQISLTQLWVSISETCWHWLYQWNEEQWLSFKRGSSGVLVHWCHDWLIDYNDKNWFTGAVFDLLSEKPEQEQVSYNVPEWFTPHMNWM